MLVSFADHNVRPVTAGTIAPAAIEAFWLRKSASLSKAVPIKPIIT
jgi:hypothetical protein